MGQRLDQQGGEFAAIVDRQPGAPALQRNFIALALIDIIHQPVECALDGAKAIRLFLGQVAEGLFDRGTGADQQQQHVDQEGQFTLDPGAAGGCHAAQHIARHQIADGKARNPDDHRRVQGPEEQADAETKGTQHHCRHQPHPGQPIRRTRVIAPDGAHDLFEFSHRRRTSGGRPAHGFKETTGFDILVDQGIVTPDVDQAAAQPAPLADFAGFVDQHIAAEIEEHQAGDDDDGKDDQTGHATPPGLNIRCA